MAPILVSLAVEAEFAFWRRLRRFGQRRCYDSAVYETMVGSTPMIVVLVGIGARRADVVAALATEHRPTAGIVAGVAAGLRPELKQGEVVVKAVRQLTERGYGADAAIEAVGSATTWEWALRMVRRGGVANLFGGCPAGSSLQLDPSLLHYSEVVVRSTFHHTPRFVREALKTIARGDVRASDFITGEISLDELPGFFQHMKNRNGELKVAVVS